MPRNIHFIAAILLLSFAVPVKAQAQVPSSVEPGVVIQQIEEPAREPSRVEDLVPLPDTRAVDGAAGTEKMFALQGVVLQGSKVYTDEDLRPLYEAYLGQEVSLNDLNTIARSVTIKYRDEGYMFSRAILPPQTIKSGILRLDAIEGRVTEVKVVGEYDDHHDTINKMAARIESDGPSNSKEIERYLLLIDDLPGVTARSVLQPSATPGGGELVITVEQDDFESSLSWDNRGSRFLGRHRITAVAAFNSLFNVFDRTTVRWLNSVFANQTSELRFADIMHEQQVGTDGLRVRGRVAITSTEPGESLEATDIDGNSQLLQLRALYPVVRSRKYNLNLLGGYDHLHSKTKVAGVQTARDKVRSVWIGTHVDFLDAMAGINQIDLRITKGVDIFNATDDGTGRSRANGEHTFLHAGITATRVQDLPGEWSYMTSFSGQYSRDPLLASEEFAVGGGTYGRAYDSGEIVGDHGATGVFELRYDGSQFVGDFVRNYQWYGFYDVGAVWNKSRVVAESKKESLASAGLGVRFNLKNATSGFFEVNAPLTRGVNSEGLDNDDPRVFFSLLKRF